jgi:hypothetical protein
MEIKITTIKIVTYLCLVTIEAIEAKQMLLKSKMLMVE